MSSDLCHRTDCDHRREQHPEYCGGLRCKGIRKRDGKPCECTKFTP